MVSSRSVVGGCGGRRHVVGKVMDGVVLGFGASDVRSMECFVAFGVA